MIVAIHQPNFLPWLGYFHKMACADRFVFLDGVPFAKGSYTNRVKIKTAAGEQWLTVPVITSGKLGQDITGVRCNDAANWRKKIAAALQTNYKQCPHYRPYGEQVTEIISAAADSLTGLNVRLVQYVADKLDIRTPTVRSSGLKAQGRAVDLLIGICHELGADTYLSGSGGANYQDEEMFSKGGIRLIYADYHHPQYPQQFGDFISGLSVIDLLCNCGPDSRSILGL